MKFIPSHIRIHVIGYKRVNYESMRDVKDIHGTDKAIKTMQLVYNHWQNVTNYQLQGGNGHFSK